MKKLLVACAISASVVLAACGKKEVSVPPTETDSVTAGVEVTAEVTTEGKTEVTTEETVETETSETATDEVTTEESGEGVTGETQTVTETETETETETGTTQKVTETETETITETTTQAPKPTEAPTEAPKPTEAPTEAPTEKPTEKPTEAPHTHGYSSKVTKESTCTETGVMTFTCECGHSYTAEIGKIDHNYVNYTYNNDATTEHDGTETGHCSMCNLAHTRTAAGTKLDKPALPNCPYPLNQFIGNFDGTDQNFCGEAFVTYWVDNSDTSAVRYSPCARDMSTIYEWTCRECWDNFEIAWNDSYVGEYAEGKVWKSAICLTPESMLPSCPYALGELFWDGDVLCVYADGAEGVLKHYIFDILGENLFDWEVHTESTVHYKEGRISFARGRRK